MFKYSVCVTVARKQGSGVGLAFRFSGGERRFGKGSGVPSPLTKLIPSRYPIFITDLLNCNIPVTKTLLQWLLYELLSLSSVSPPASLKPEEHWRWQTQHSALIFELFAKRKCFGYESLCKDFTQK